MVDFEFSNGYQKSILVEFKLLSNRGLQSDGGLSQDPTVYGQYEDGYGIPGRVRIDEKDAEMVRKNRSCNKTNSNARDRQIYRIGIHRCFKEAQCQ